jgi:hypothetical protein
MLDSHKPLLVKVLLSAAIAVSAALGACSTVEGVTPDCTFNLVNGGINATSGGCEGFAVCAKDPQNPAACCLDDQGAPLTGGALDACLYGYGAGGPPSTSTGTGGTGGGTGTGGSQ